MRRSALMLTLAVLLSGCLSHHEAQEENMTAALSNWIGKPVAEYIGERGPPATTVPLGPTKKMFQWVFTNASSSLIVPVGGMIIAQPSQTLVCRVTFTAEAAKADLSLEYWLITNYQWAGAC